MEKKIKKSEVAVQAEDVNVLSKNFASLCIYFILRKYTDYKHRLTQNEIAQKLKEIYGIGLERKAVGRIISSLQNGLKFEIGNDRDGYYFCDPDFLQTSEIELINDALFCCRYLPQNYTKDIIKKLCNESSVYFKSKNAYLFSSDGLSKNNNKSIFTNIEIVSRAIEEKKQIQFDYNRWGTDHKLHKTNTHIVSPYRLVVHSGRYYLKCHDEAYPNSGVYNYRVDFITDMKIIKDSKATPVKTLEGFENGLSNKHLGANLPYMYTDKEESIEFYVIPEVVGQIIDWLGDSVAFDLKPAADGRYRALISSSPTAMKFFAIQYAEEIEITKPQHLRDEVYNVLSSAIKKYEADIK